MANGKFYGQYSTPELVMGGKESKLSLTPSAPGKCITGLGSSDKSWLTYDPLGTDDNNTGIDVKILLDPDTIDRTGFIWVKSNYNPSQPYDTIYVRQPGTRCINPKQGSVGQQFFVAFMENGEQNLPGYLYLYATSDTPTTKVSIKNGVSGSDVSSSTLSQNKVARIYAANGYTTAAMQNLPAYNYQSEQIASKSFFVEATSPISLYAYTAESMTAEISYIIPVEALGDEYFTVSYYGNYFGSYYTYMPEEFLIIATENNTPVTITPADDTYGATGSNGKAAGNPFTIVLNRGQTYLVKSKSNPTALTMTKPGLTGTHIKAGKPVAVFGGNKRALLTCIDNDYYSNSRDHLFEQLLPLTSWGKRYALVQTQQPTNPYRIVAAYNNTGVTIKNSTGTVKNLTLHRGQFYEAVNYTDTSPYVYIEADQPVEVALFAESHNCYRSSSALGDPFLIALGAADRGISDATFTPIDLISKHPTEGAKHYVTVIVETRYKDFTKFKRTSSGTSFPATLTFTEMPNTPYSYAIGNVIYDPDFNYHLSNPYGFTAYAYGYGNAESYGYLLGAQLGKKVEEGSEGVVSRLEYCRGAQPDPLPACINGATACPDKEKQYYWYASLDEWRGDNPMPQPPAISTAADTTYTFFASRWGRCGVLYPQQVTIEVKPLPEVIFENDTVCLSATAADYGARPKGGTYTFDGGAKNGQPFSHKAAGAGSHAVKYTYTSERGCATEKTAWVTVETLDKDPYIWVAVGDDSLCDGDRVVLEVANATKNRTFQWYHADTIIPGSTGSSYAVEPGASVYAGGKYSAHVYNSNGCETTVDANIAIYAKPDKPKIATWSSTAACTGASYTLYDAEYVVPPSEASGRYQWYKTELNPANKIPNATGNSYTVTNETVSGIRHFVLGAVNPIPGRGIDKGCWSYDEFDITVYKPANTPQIMEGSREICDGDSVKLTASAISGDRYAYQWYSKNEDQSISKLTSSGAAIYVKEGEYMVESISEHGCTSTKRSSAVQVTPREKPGKPYLTPGATVCEGGTISITAAAILPSGGATSYQWYAVGQNGAYTAINGAAAAAYGAVQSGRYAAIAKTAYSTVACASAYSDTLSVTLWPTPLNPVVAGATDVCIGNRNVALTASPAPNSAPVEKYQWYKNALQLTASIGDTLRVTQAENAAAYSVEAISAQGCVSGRTPKAVTVHSPTVAIAGAAERDTCFGNLITLTTTSNVGLGSTYEWYRDGRLEAGANQLSYVVSGSSSGTQTTEHYLYVTDKYGCKSAASNTVKVSIHMTKSDFKITSRDTCAGNDLLLTASGIGAGTYRWFFKKDGILTEKGTTTAHTLTIPNADASHAGEYVVRITNSNGCISEGKGSATVYALPSKPTITPDARHLCSGDSVRLLVEPVESYSYAWFFTNDRGKSSLAASSNRIYAKKTGDYSMKIRNTNGCWSAESDAVPVETHRKPERPAIYPAGDTVAVCSNTSTTISAFAAGVNTSYQWYSIDRHNRYTEIGGANAESYAVKESGRYAARAYLPYSGTDRSGATYALTCPSDSISAPRQALLFQVPSPPRIATNSSSACAGATIVLRAELEPGERSIIASFRWYKDNAPTYSTSSDTCFVSQIEDASYAVAAISARGCTSPVSLPQKVSIRRPSVSIVDTIKPKCFGEFITLTATTNTTSNSTCEWYKDGALIPNANAISYVVQSDGNPTDDNSAIYHVYVVDDGGCRSAASNKVKVAINGLPPSPLVVNPPPVCEGSSATLTVSPSGAGTYQWYFEKNGVTEAVGAASNDTSCRKPIVRASDAGRYAVTITNRWGCTSKGWGEVQVYALPQTPVMTPGDAVHLCTGDSALISAYTAGASRYEWQFNSGLLPATADRLYAAMPGIYSVRSVSERGCKSRESGAVQVALHSRPETPAIAPSGRISVCSNGSTAISAFASGATSYQWYAVDTATGSHVIISGATGSVYKVEQSGHYAVQADILHSDNSASPPYRRTCSSLSAPKEVELFPILLPPVVTGEKTPTGEKTSGCEGETLTLTASAPGNVASYKWYKDATEMTSVTTASYTITQVGAAKYKVEAMSDKGCRSEASTPKEVNIRRRPTVSIADGERESCGGTIALSAITTPPPPEIGARYEWYKDADTAYLPGASTSPTYVVKGSSVATEDKKASYYLFVTDRYGCRSAAASNTVEVNIRGLPPTPVATAYPADGVCENENATLRVSPSGAGTYTWFKWNGDSRTFNPIAATSDTSFRILSAQTADAGQYAVEITNTYGCKSALKGETGLNVLGLPIVNIIETRACESWTAEHTVDFAEPKGGLFSGGGCKDGKFIPEEVRQGNAAVTYSYTGLNGCTNRDSKIIEIIRLPNTPIVSAAGPTAVCEDSVTVTLKANVAVIPGYEYAASYTYQWRKDGAALPGEDSAAYVAIKEGAYDVRVCNQGLCWALNPSAPVAVSVIPKPTPPVIESKIPLFCPGESTELLVDLEQSEAGSYQWYEGDSKEMRKIPGEIAAAYSADRVGQYAVKLFGERGCWSKLSNLITVGEHPLPAPPEVAPSQPTLFAGMDYALAVKNPQPGEVYEWYKNNLSIDLSAAAFPIYNLNGDDTGRYSVKAINEHGCYTWSNVYALAWSESQLFIPNIFTPNGDGVNDYFQILGLEAFAENKLNIVNRRGTVIFSQKNYQNTWNGEGEPNDIYYYLLELKREDGATSLLRGYVHLRQ